MMKLYYSPASPYARKARFIMHELGLDKQVELVHLDPRADAETLRRVNPLGKIPALQLDDGSVIYDSPVICEYLDDLGGGKFFPTGSIFAPPKGKWRALTLQALGDGLADATVLRTMELRRPETQQSPETIARHITAIRQTLAVCERAVEKFTAAPGIGEIAIACALGYLDYRFPDEGWRAAYPKLAAWYEGFSQHPAMLATAIPKT